MKKYHPDRHLSPANTKQPELSGCISGEVDTYEQLVEEVARLSCQNNNVLLFFRGQNEDFPVRGSVRSSLLPSIYRKPFSYNIFRNRSDRLRDAERLLIEKWKNSGLMYYNRVKHWQYIRWSILQHYEVVPTPLLDVTQSLNVACSFGIDGNKNGHFYVYVLALPYTTGRISVNSEEQIVNIRLLSICPFDAKRPYFQEGYLIGDDDFEVVEPFDQSSSKKFHKDKYDFKHRLIAKYKLPNSDAFWGKHAKPIPHDLLYPQDDKVMRICNEIENELKIRDTRL